MTALNSGSINPRLFFEIVTSSGSVYYWTGNYNLPWAGHIWAGNGYLRSWDKVENTLEKDSGDLSITLAGEPAAMKALLFKTLKQNRLGRLYFAIVDDNGELLVNPQMRFLGKLDTAQIDIGADRAEITLVYTNALVDLNIPKEYRFNDASQRAWFPDDDGFMYVAQLEQGYVGYWGKINDRPKKTGHRKKHKRNR